MVLVVEYDRPTLLHDASGDEGGRHCSVLTSEREKGGKVCCSSCVGTAAEQQPNHVHRANAV